MENKVFTLKFENGKLLVDIDSNKDGKKVLQLAVDMGEALTEILALFKKPA
jgi:hypothetical protein